MDDGQKVLCPVLRHVLAGSCKRGTHRAGCSSQEHVSGLNSICTLPDKDGTSAVAVAAVHLQPCCGCRCCRRCRCCCCCRCQNHLLLLSLPKPPARQKLPHIRRAALYCRSSEGDCLGFHPAKKGLGRPVRQGVV